MPESARARRSSPATGPSSFEAPPLEEPGRSVPPSQRRADREGGDGGDGEQRERRRRRRSGSHGSHGSRSRRGDEARGRRAVSRPLSAVLMTIAVLVVAGWVWFDAGRIMLADLASMQARWQVGQWVSGARKPPTDAEWSRAHRSLQAALEWTPDDPVLHDRLGDLHAVAGARDWDDEERSLASYRRAIDHYKGALALRPGDPQTWASLAAAYTGAGERESPEFAAAWSQALKLGPQEGHVQPMLMSLAMSNWDVATPAMRDWVTGFYRKAAEPQRKALHKVAARYGLQFDDDGQLLAIPDDTPRSGG